MLPLKRCSRLDLWCVRCRTFAAIAEDPKFHISKILRPGEIEIISNQFILHSRGDVFDGEVCT